MRLISLLLMTEIDNLGLRERTRFILIGNNGSTLAQTLP